MSTKPLAVAVYSPRALAIRHSVPGTIKPWTPVSLADSLASMTSMDSLASVDKPTVTVRATTSRLAVASAVCALFGFLHVSGFFAGVVLGHVALVRIRRSRGSLRGRGIARAALVASWTPIALVTGIGILMFLIGLQATINAS